MSLVLIICGVYSSKPDKVLRYRLESIPNQFQHLCMDKKNYLCQAQDIIYYIDEAGLAQDNKLQILLGPLFIKSKTTS